MFNKETGKRNFLTFSGNDLEEEKAKKKKQKKLHQ